ncbi:hypothetical protein PO587_02705 [Streptomyces gilvifuscus]|uniref:Uncharacterized protein n=1 Tax=Streptomyces gilvifuscus TaxID=1550617 RepID=A0ABT5FLF4_9ACTN|nr:hypothetical protein [Streptomyces gilvifuscus]MDC2953361.1 hypothetical protein [Streptomyces gilvifuscus]
MSAVDDLIVGYGPEQVEDITIHQDAPGEPAVIETVTVRPLRVFEKCPDGSLKELFGEAKDNALTAFWADVARFNSGEDE